MFKLVFLLSLCGQLAVCRDPTLLFNVKHMEIANYENPYMGDFSVVINTGGKETPLNLTLPLKDVLPEDTVMNVAIITDGVGTMKNMSFKLCSLLHEPMVGRDLFSNTSPPVTECPIQPGILTRTYYIMNKDLLPPLKNGIYKIYASVADGNGQVWTTFYSESEVSHEIPVPQLG